MIIPNFFMQKHTFIHNFLMFYHLHDNHPHERIFALKIHKNKCFAKINKISIVHIETVMAFSVT